MLSGSYPRSRASRPRWGRRIAAVLAVLVVLAAVVVGLQLTRSSPGLTTTAPLRTTLRLGGPARALPWPAQGSGAVEVLGVGMVGSLHGQQPLPLASVTKLMTALVVLARHPLAPGAGGPTLTITRGDASTYRADLASGQSVLAVRAGERLDEREALEGLLVPSANNIALALARWDAGSVAAFVAKMNATAATFGLTHTRFVEPSGVASGDTGSALDMMRLGALALANPTIAGIVRLGEVDLPVAGTVINYDYLLGQHGIIGIKTGSSNAAGGNYVFAARSVVDGRTLTVVGAVLHQEGVSRIDSALAAGERLAVAALAHVRRVELVRRGMTVVRVRAPWSGATAAGRTSSAVEVLTIAGSVSRIATTLDPSLAQGRDHSLRRGEQVGVVTVTFAGHRYTVPVVASASLSGPSLHSRLTRF